MTRHLRRKDYRVGRNRIRRLKRKTNLAALTPHKNRRNRSHEPISTCCRDLAVTRANRVWHTDVTYIPMGHGFLSLVAVMDWHTR